MPPSDPVTVWRDALAEWAIPAHIQRAATRSPWATNGSLFVARARASVAALAGPSYETADEALRAGGTVLDIGAGAGAAGLALAGRAGSLCGVDTDERLL